ncbi:hypothetical protein DSI35_21900 [Mycobacterium tuberculosis]|uniref:Uncharacterized protein n=4 Tax=Mycobacterium tuberculosis complex TaxID=77643 RepID=Q8VJF8_MYCTO|nr:hypothetical protein MT2627.1 [Mycobacterium tuberculosis CDC1551]AKR02380.1 hypothetical protein Mb1595_p2857 [Mycobacterium tuberculosis variant bovis]APR57902.1 hypothetical protein BTU11_14020 [Mycobacterium tuberculosis]AYP12820.1 hypothetical protein EBQ37_14235 [Mycobacterium tuberculosis variant bovis BCG]EFD48121.1 conserved hypothetical protein [Mycobacterium tuberculosis T17]EPZ65628.1 hypothetical protein TBKG_03508 [Mycobacterium tuberculosis '98-R604 INH-RIF-EM']KAK26193.1 hy
MDRRRRGGVAACLLVTGVSCRSPRAGLERERSCMGTMANSAADYDARKGADTRFAPVQKSALSSLWPVA